MRARRLTLAVVITALAGCAGGVDEGLGDEDFSHPDTPEDAEIPDGADVPLLPPNEGEKDDAQVAGEDAADTGVLDAGAPGFDAPASATDVASPTPEPRPDVVVLPLDTGGPAPGPPVACRHSVGPFAWSCDGAIAGLRCVALTEPQDPHSWRNNHLCTREDLGVRWSSAGAIAGLRCVAVREPAEPEAHGWGDNHLCVPTDSPYQLSWSWAGPIPNTECVPWHEPEDPHTWADNYLCWTMRAVTPPRCTGSASGQSAVWTCTADRSARQRCVSGRVETVRCAYDCVPQPSGTNDYCAPRPPPANTLPDCRRRDLLRWGLHPDASDRLRCAGVPAARITQTIGYAAASAGTHAPDGRVNGVQYGAATDISTRGLSATAIRTLLSRLADQGFAAWYRHPGADGWPSNLSPHIHAIYVGCRMKSALQAQVRDWLIGRNGLTSHRSYAFHRWTSAQIALIRAVYDRFN